MNRSADGGHTFAFVDLAGFTALTEAHGDDEAADLIDRFVELTVASLRGDDRLVKTIGDAVMLVSPDPGSGLVLVRRIVDACLGESRFPAPRAGLHHGPAVERNDDFVGAAVNLAARVAAQATEGTAVVTEHVAREAQRLGMATIALGARRLRNVSQNVELWAIELRDAPVATVVDPVCRMQIRGDQVIGHVRWEEREFVFCSLKCLGAFADAPERYVL